MEITTIVVILGIVLIILIAAMAGASHLELKLKNIPFIEALKISFFPQNFANSNFYVKSTQNIGFIVSTDGKIYKVHSTITIKVSEESSINNAKLFISNIGWFVFRQFYRETPGGRAPHRESILLHPNEVREFGLEFEPREGWDPIKVEQKTYSALLNIVFLQQSIDHKFKFQVRRQNIEAIERASQSNSQLPIIIETPIIENK